MMGLTFDLISDLHVDSWHEEFDWTGRATSPHALVLGDIAQDRDLLVHALTNLAQCYQAVFYVDGNLRNNNHFNLKTVCLNCCQEVYRSKLPWKRSTLTPDY